MIQLYYGDGKGKTTAAVGLAVRAAGAGIHVHIIQFFKGGESSEFSALDCIANISYARCGREYGFSFCMTPEEKQELTACHNKNLAEGMEMYFSGKCGVLILDELIDSYNESLIDREMVHRLLESGGCGELVITGHSPCGLFLDCADYISEVVNRKHPYACGLAARKGIEF